MWLTILHEGYLDVELYGEVIPRYRVLAMKDLLDDSSPQVLGVLGTNVII